MTDSPLVYREWRPSDRRFVVGAWRDSYRTAHAAGMVPMPLWDEVFERCADWVLARPGVEVWVAAHPTEDPATRADLYGFAAVERSVSVPGPDGQLVPADGPLVHYVFVKLGYRRRGIARGLLAAAGVRADMPALYTCKTGVVSRVAPPSWRWAPLVARYPKGVTP